MQLAGAGSGPSGRTLAALLIPPKLLALAKTHPSTLSLRGVAIVRKPMTWPRAGSAGTTLSPTYTTTNQKPTKLPGQGEIPARVRDLRGDVPAALRQRAPLRRSSVR